MIASEEVASRIGYVVARRGWKRDGLGKEEEKNRDDHCESRLVLERKGGKEGRKGQS